MLTRPTKILVFLSVLCQLFSVELLMLLPAHPRDWLCRHSRNPLRQFEIMPCLAMLADFILRGPPLVRISATAPLTA